MARGRPKRDVFISHASQDLALAKRIEAALESDGLDVWLDESEIQLGVLLAGELQASIEACRVLFLLWSAKAAESRWVNTEWLAAYHLDRFILPAVSDDTLLPQCLEHSVHLDLRRDLDAAIARLSKAVRAAPAAANQVAPPLRSESAELRQAIDLIAAGQKDVTDALGKRDVTRAEQTQMLLDAVMPKMLARWPLDPMIVKLDGYHIKNGYMVRHWDALQSGRGPADSVLEQSEKRFFEALWLEPTDPEGLDGLGSILMLRRDLHAAEFFFECAVEQARRRGIDYGAAKENLATVRRYLARRASN